MLNPVCWNDGVMDNDWSRQEVETTVEDYFDMLLLELTGRPYNKAEHCCALRSRLNQRSDGSRAQAPEY